MVLAFCEPQAPLGVATCTAPPSLSPSHQKTVSRETDCKSHGCGGEGGEEELVTYAALLH
jgi:hypothetical protein